MKHNEAVQGNFTRRLRINKKTEAWTRLRFLYREYM